MTIRPYIVLVYLLITCMIFSECQCESKEGKVEPKKFDNIIVLLDLSDRILNPGQLERDKRVIMAVFNAFVAQIKKDLYFASKAKFRIVIARQEQNPNSLEMNDLLDSFYVNMETTPINEKKKIKTKNISANLNRLFKLAQYSKYHNDYKGADIVGYLRDDLSSDLQDSTSHINKIVILTDGYLYVDNAHGSKETWPVVTNLERSDIAFLELSPRNFKSGELHEMKSRLKIWVSKMKCGEVLLQHSTSMPTITNKINKFLNNK